MILTDLGGLRHRQLGTRASLGLQRPPKGLLKPKLDIDRAWTHVART